MALLLLGGSLSGWAQKQRRYEVQVVEIAAHRTHEGTIALDGRLRNTGERPIEKLIIIFDFLAPGGAVISTQKYETDEEVLESGADTIFQAKIDDHVRAVKYRVAAVTRSGRNLHVTKPGPYVIE